MKNPWICCVIAAAVVPIGTYLLLNQPWTPKKAAASVAASAEAPAEEKIPNGWERRPCGCLQKSLEMRLDELEGKVKIVEAAVKAHQADAAKTNRK